MDTETLPAAFVDWTGLNTVYGALNPTAESLSTEDVFASNVKIYPNPTNGVVNIQSNNAEITSVSVYDLLGKQVFATDKLIDNQINLSGLNHGVYMLDVQSGNRSVIKKIIIE